MPINAYDLQSIPAGGGPFPCFGTALTAATIPNRTPQNDVYPSGFLPMAVAVGDTSMFRVTSRALLVKANGSLSIPCDIASIVSGTSATVRFQYSGIAAPAFAAGDFLALNETINSVTVQGVSGSAGDYYFGKGPAFTTSTRCFWHMAKQPAGIQDPYFNSNLIFGGYPLNTSEFWVIGTAGDQFRPSTLL